jgi:hypothetical protein
LTERAKIAYDKFHAYMNGYWAKRGRKTA